ncbi:putative E3 ubiquitin-protein ligase UBR7 isoform X2 [Watersipora subatra]|uniref:putative E3 ubiquitin-protein ligase UBR7 isoform X2 n=1 Tax=Watersipora subatra TaxID=2589382 RepID=UPI00355BDE4E
MQLKIMADMKASGSSEQENEQLDGAISLNEFMEAERNLEDDARAVLGGSDASTCTYSQGYVQRQALYSCATCQDLSGAVAGICLACSLDCHDGHDLYELYTKRSFRCDCGNNKFQTECKLQKDKEPFNDLNRYDQNFKGVYCSCHRPYPDPDNEDGEMIQCCLCEDWYHDNHLEMKTDIPEYEEMICVGCVRRHPFLVSYQGREPTEPVIATGEESKEVDIISTSTTSTGCSSTATDASDASSQPTDTSVSDSSVSSDPPSVHHTPSTSGSNGSCKNFTPAPPADCKTLFMTSGWRQELCTCASCALYYKSNHLEYLLDQNDPTHVYEQRSKDSGDSYNSYDKGMNALSNLGRVQQIELLTGYNDMKSSLSDYLKNFASNDKVVTAEDIKEFFEDYGKSKRRRLAVPPSSCH